jgi:hypothetical protein
MMLKLRMRSTGKSARSGTSRFFFACE